VVRDRPVAALTHPASVLVLVELRADRGGGGDQGAGRPHFNRPLTVVALGTSLPELAIGIDAVRQGSPGLAVGNIVGTNLVDLLFILGLSALILPIAFERRTLRFDLPAMTAACLALWLLARDSSLSRLDGTILCVGGVAYTAGIVWTSRREAAPVSPTTSGLPCEAGEGSRSAC
jgi:cation:H+ antiporter